ncbi:uncharacterized protein [Antedon mediterranea]|uniref:uncharacterized protein n=1 Tax=Antedon mediterranea TaxID=105859 RepID=UPI003AF94697
MSSQSVQFRCQDHPTNTLERFCTTCTKSTCKDCEQFVSCYTEKHDTKPMVIAVDAFNKRVNEVIMSAKDAKQELEDIFNSIISDDREFKLQVGYIKKLIENLVEVVVKKVKDEGEKLMMNLNIVCKRKEEAIDRQVKELEPHQLQLQNLKASVTEITDKPEFKTLLDSYKSDIEEVKQNIDKMNHEFISYENNLTPNFTINAELDGDISKGLGKITSVDKRYIITEDDQCITAIKGQPFAVTVENVDEHDTGTLTAKLIKQSHTNIAIHKVEYMESGKSTIKGRCNEEGEWKMEITNGVASIKGSPVNITVLPTLVQTIDNIGSLKEDNTYNVTDVALDSNGCMLVSSLSNELLKFNQSGSFIANIKVPNVQAHKILHVGIGQYMFSDPERGSVVICNDRYEEIYQLGKGTLKFPSGLAVNNETRIMYITDRKGRCVYTFSKDNGKLKGKISSKGNLITPYDIISTKEGNLLIPDCSINTIQMFNSNGVFMKTIVDGGKEDGKVWNPRSIVMDKEENLIVSSDHKLQLFDKNGIFIKRIDDVNDNIDTPAGITVISNNPRRLAVANYGANNVKIFNY